MVFEGFCYFVAFTSEGPTISSVRSQHQRSYQIGYRLIFRSYSHGYCRCMKASITSFTFIPSTIFWRKTIVVPTYLSLNSKRPSSSPCKHICPDFNCITLCTEKIPLAAPVRPTFPFVVLISHNPSSFLRQPGCHNLLLRQLFPLLTISNAFINSTFFAICNRSFSKCCHHSLWSPHWYFCFFPSTTWCNPDWQYWKCSICQ